MYINFSIICIHLAQQAQALSAIPARWLNLQEHHSKELMAKYGVTVQRFKVADTHHDAVQVGKDLSKHYLPISLCEIYI